MTTSQVFNSNSPNAHPPTPSLYWSSYWLTDQLTSQWGRSKPSPHLWNPENKLVRRVDLEKPPWDLVSSQWDVLWFVCMCVFVACVLRKPHDAKDVNCSRVAEETGHVESPEKRQEEPAFKISWWWRDLCQLLAPMLFLSSLLNISTDACSDPQTLLSCFWVLHMTSSQHTYSHEALGKQKSVYDVFNRSRIIKTSRVDKKKKRGRVRNRPNKSDCCYQTVQIVRLHFAEI